jgi:hypothetical protein
MIVTFTAIREISPDMVEEVEMAVLDVIAAGATALRFGGASGGDTMALEAACRVRDAERAITTVFVPFRVYDQPKDARAAIELYADEVVEMNLRPGKSAYLTRNRRMVDGSHLVVALTDGRLTGGTAYTIGYAQKKEIPVVVVPVTSIRKNPRVTGIDTTGKIWAIEEYDHDEWLTKVIRANKTGHARQVDLNKVASILKRQIRSTKELNAADAICAMPRRVPGAKSDMEPIARDIADSLDLEMAELVRVDTPKGGELRAGRMRFSPSEHERTLRYTGPKGDKVIVLDNVLTSAGTMEGAFRAVRAAGSTPLGLAALYGASLGAKAVAV